MLEKISCSFHYACKFLFCQQALIRPISYNYESLACACRIKDRDYGLTYFLLLRDVTDLCSDEVEALITNNACEGNGTGKMLLNLLQTLLINISCK